MSASRKATNTKPCSRCYSLYEPTVMFFGLTNSPATFQTMMNHIFHPVIAKHKLLGTSICVYMDNIAIPTHTNDNDHTAQLSAMSLPWQLNITYISNWRNVLSTSPVSIT